MPRPISLLVLCLLPCACAGPTIPEGQGRGLVSFDRTPPAGEANYTRPQWQAGDRLVYLRGNALRVSLVVEADAAGYRLVQQNSGEVQQLDQDLGDLGLFAAPVGKNPAKQEIAIAPADARYHWPLWLGKRWSCHFLRKAPGQPPLPLLVAYEVEGFETVRVPAGSFETLRILRRANVAADGTFLERTALSWYAPSLGIEVRRLEDSILTELAEVHRQEAAPSAAK